MIFCALVIAIIAVVSSYVPGSHDWKYDFSSPSTEKCPECHDEIETEILSMPVGSPHRAGYVADGCGYCHLNATVGVTQENHTGLMPELQLMKHIFQCMIMPRQRTMTQARTGLAWHAIPELM
jgi:hypothetical protein